MIQKLKVNPVAHFTRSEFNGYLDSVHALGEGRALCRVATFGKELHFFIVSAREMTKLSWVPEPEMTRQLSAPTASSSNTVNWQRGVAMLTREHLILWECLEDMPRVVTIEHPLSADRNGRLQDIHDVTMLSNKGCMVALLTKHSSKIDPVALARLSWTSASARAAWIVPHELRAKAKPIRAGGEHHAPVRHLTPTWPSWAASWFLSVEPFRQKRSPIEQVPSQ